MIPKFADIVTIMAFVRCLNSGQSLDQVAASSKMSKQKILGMLRAAGYRRTPKGTWLVG